MGPTDPAILHPMPEQPQVVLLRPLVKSPLIEVGGYVRGDHGVHDEPHSRTQRASPAGQAGEQGR